VEDAVEGREELAGYRRGFTGERGCRADALPERVLGSMMIWGIGELGNLVI
jgi:hypothetical protein